MELTCICILSLVFVALIAADFNIFLKLLFSLCVGYLIVMLSIAISLKDERYDQYFNKEIDSDDSD
jgi:cell division protein FtsW (lipid II flippase)